MSATINTTLQGYTVTNPMSRQQVTFNGLLQAISYCRYNGFIYSFAL